MSEHNFRLLLEVPHALTDDDLNALYAATGSDGSFGSDDDGWSAEFDRETPGSYADAVLQAISQIEHSGTGVHVRQLVSDADALLSVSEMGRRTGSSREAIRLYVEGERNQKLGPFPAPVATFASGQKIWRWGDVVPWLSRAVGRDLGSSEAGYVASAINGYLQMDRALEHVSPDARQAVTHAVERELAAVR